MKKIEANSLEEAYDIACKEFGCSIRELKYEIIQYPQKGVFGLFAKKAIIVATQSKVATDEKTSSKQKEEKKEEISEERILEEESKAEENLQTIKAEEFEEEKIKKEENKASLEPKSEILENFFDESSQKKILNETVLAQKIENDLKNLFKNSCFEIDTIEVDVKENTAFIFIDGKDAALLIGKEGYRYNALSYLLFNWLNKAYGLYIKLEIAEFISTQENMIKNYIKPVVEHVYTYGWGKTRPLDGILVQIALEQLREEFPNKYVAIKKQKDGSKYIIINDFNKRL